MILTKEEVAKLNKQRAKKLQNKQKAEISKFLEFSFKSIREGRLVTSDNIFKAIAPSNPETQALIAKELKKLGFSCAFHSDGEFTRKCKRGGRSAPVKRSFITIDLNV